MTNCYSMTGQNEAWVSVDENAEATVTLRSRTSIKPRAVYVGEAKMAFNWVSTGKTSHWQFTPTLLNPTKAEYSETQNGLEQTIKVNFGNGLFPASGLLNANVCGEIRAPAVHFDLPYAMDLWVFLLRSPEGLKVETERQTLSITHALAQVVLRLESERYGEEGTLRAYVNMHGEGFNYVEVKVKRSTRQGSFEEQIGEVKDGGGSFTWRPKVRNFDVALITLSSMGQNQFLDFLKSLGAEVKTGVFANLKDAFVLCDGSVIDYTLMLKGDKKYIGKEEDQTKLRLNVV